MKLYICKKSFNKEFKEARNAIICSMEMLYERIKSYEIQGISFNRIFNDDKVKYDKQGKFFTFKNQKCNMQVRILYHYFLDEDEPTFLVADYFIKKRNKKEYISQFDVINTCDPAELLKKSFSITTA